MSAVPRPLRLGGRVNHDDIDAITLRKHRVKEVKRVILARTVSRPADNKHETMGTPIVTPRTRRVCV
jgi:hypothetical protein